MGAVPNATPWTPEGPLALPGVYTLKLTVDGNSSTQTVTVKNDPRSPAPAAELSAQHDLLMRLFAGSSEAWDGYTQVTAMRSALGALSASNPPADVAGAIAAFTAKLVSAGGSGGAGGRGGGGGRGAAPAGPPPVPNFAGLVGAMNRQLDGLDFGDQAPTEPMLKAWSWVCADLKTAVSNWKNINSVDLVAFNGVLAKSGLPAIKAAGPMLTSSVCSAGAKQQH
jgi:hypothetical protein